MQNTQSTLLHKVSTPAAATTTVLFELRKVEKCVDNV